MRFTRAGASLATAGLALLALGIGMANVELLALAVLPLALLAYPAATRGAADPTGARMLSTRTPRRADVVDAQVRIELPDSPDLVEVHAPLPGTWRLEEGSNLHALVGKGARSFRFKARALGRGKHVVAPMEAEMQDLAGVLAPRRAQLADEIPVEVAPRTIASRPVRGRLRGALALPEQENARLGTGTSDFRELRDYQWGDPPKAINWKATARRLSARARQGAAPRMPLVNEFEHEDRRAVVVLLDGGEPLRVGTTLEMGLDHGIEAALAAARFFLGRGTRVGAATYGARSHDIAPPDAGTGQIFAVERSLAAGEPDRDETPLRALERFHRHLAGTQPLVIVVTRVTPASSDALVALARRLRVVVGSREKALPLLVLDIEALPLVPQDDAAIATAAALVARDDARARLAVQSAGARVVPWKLGERDFRLALMRGGRA